MPDRAKKKQQKELKRKQKAQLARKAAAAGPWKAIADGKGTLQVWMNDNWRDTHQASIFAVRSFSTSSIVGSYLVDLGMAGLKDAWDQNNISASELKERFDSMADMQVPMKPVNPEEAMRLIRGSVRFAHDNGFRLPRNYEKIISILRPLGDWRQADVSDFIMEFAGSMDDLRRRLIGQSLEEFLAREDVHLVLSDDAPSLLADAELDEQLDAIEELDEDEVSDMTKRLCAEMAESVRIQCLAAGERPEPMLVEAIELITWVMGRLLDETRSADGSQPVTSDYKERFDAMMEREIALEPPAERAGLRSAAEQFMRFKGFANSSGEAPKYLDP